MINRNKAKWLGKLAKSKNFIVLTDKESVINIQGVDPKNFNDMFTVSSQLGALMRFRARIDAVIRRFEKEVEGLVTVPKPKGRKKPVSKGKKIPVREIK